MQPLTATSNPVRRARALLHRDDRAEQRAFLVEGPQAVRAALGGATVVREVFVTEDCRLRHEDLTVHAVERAVPVRLVDDDAIGRLTTSVTPQGVVAVCELLDLPLERALESSTGCVAVAAHLRDPGNAGSLLRAADAAGAAPVVFAGSSVDPYNAKAVRASVGSLFHVPFTVGVAVPEALTALRAAGLTTIAADAAGDISLDQAIDSGLLAGPVAWVFGNEAWGFDPDELTLCDRVVFIPIYGQAESLNVATAAAVCLYATARAQRA